MNWEYHLPINPPGSYATEEDVILDRVDLANWTEHRKPTFRPRLRDKIQQAGGIELDEEEFFDCD
jgi:hypothetical protein